MLEVLHRHLESVFSERLGNRVARPLRPVVETMVKHVRYYERGHGRPRRDANLVKVVEDFSRGVSDILRAFGEAPPPAPPMPAALLALRVGAAPPMTHGHVRCGGAVSGNMGRGMGRVMGAGLGGSVAGGDGSAVTTGMPITAWNDDPDVHNSYPGGVATSAAPVIASRGSGGQSRTLAPAAARAAAVAQSIGLSVKLGNPEMRGGACAPPSPSTALSPAASAAAAVAALSPVAASGTQGSVAAAGRRAGGNGTSAMSQQEHVVGLAGSADFEAKLMAAAAEPDGAVDSQVAQLLQHVMLMMQQAQQQAQQQDLQGNHLQVVRAASESGHPVSALQQQQALLLQQQLLKQHQLQHQAEQQRQVLLQRYYSDPVPAGDPMECTNSSGATALASMKSGGSSVHLTQADVAARQLQLLQIKQQQQNVQTQSHEQMQQQQQQQQSQQATWQHMLAQRATANAEALQVQAQAQMQATSQAQVQHLSRASSGGGSILSPAGSMVSPGASVAPAPAWQTLLADAHQRQQLQQQQQQMLLLHQAAAAAAASTEPMGGTVSSESTSSAAVLDGGGAGPTPEVLALLRQTFFAHPQ
ncbi:hypothetical protein Vafri_3087 [Volvox africanus]|nr:hypothetical protein Vafri_3087 [Volvox africanus]